MGSAKSSGLSKKIMFLILSAGIILTACSHSNCGAEKRALKSGVVMDKSTSGDHIKVFKFDGSLQCGQGEKIALSEMQKELKDILVISSENKNDGMMRIQLCGSPTGNCNVYEIDRKDLEAALKYGFKEWTAE
jgi:hypothetical protein